MTFKYIYDLSLLFEMSSVYTITKSQNALKCSKMKRGSDMQHHVFFQNKKNKKNVFNLVQIYWNILNVPRATML